VTRGGVKDPRRPAEISGMRRVIPLLLALLAVAACGGNSSSEAGRLATYTAFGQRFGQALLKGDFLAAYAMTGRIYQSANDLSAFRDLFDRAREEYGEASHVTVGYNTLEAEGELGEGLDFPDEVKAKDRRARIVLYLHDGPDGDVVYEVWLNILSEGGADRICTVEIPGINM